MMMGEVARMVTAEHEWTAAAVGLVALYGCISLFQTYVLIFGRDLRGFRARLQSRARLCLDRTGFVGALIARHTLLVTINVLALTLSLNLLSAIRGMDDHSAAYALLTHSLQALAVVSVGQVIVIATISLALCNAVIRLAEEERR